jgi:hypothetical protein
MWRSVLLFVPTALAFIAVLLIGYLVARLLRTAVTRGLHKAGLDRTAAARMLGPRGVASELAGKLAFYGVLLFTLQLAFGLWGPNPVSALLTDVIAWLPQLLIAIVLVIVAAAIARAAQDLVAGALGGLPYGRILARSVSVVIIAVGVIAALDQVRVATAVTRPLLIAVLATIAGVVIVGVGGGLIRPMQERWAAWLDRAGAESTAIREHARAYADRPRPAADDETQVIRAPRTAADDTVIVSHGPNDTVVIADDTESTQVIKPAGS